MPTGGNACLACTQACSGKGLVARHRYPCGLARRHPFSQREHGSRGDACGDGRLSAVFLHVSSDAVDDFVERCLRAEAGDGVKLIHAGNTAHHVFKARLVSFVVGNKFDT